MQAMREWESLVDAALFPRHATTTTVHPAQQRQPRHALQRLLQGPWISVKSRLWEAFAHLRRPYSQRRFVMDARINLIDLAHGTLTKQLNLEAA